MESHGGIMVLWLANGQTGRGCRRLSAVLGVTVKLMAPCVSRKGERGEVSVVFLSMSA